MRCFRMWLWYSCLFLWVSQEKKVPFTYLIVSLHRLSSLKNTLGGLSWWWDFVPDLVMFPIGRCQLFCEHIHNITAGGTRSGFSWDWGGGALHSTGLLQPLFVSMAETGPHPHPRQPQVAHLALRASICGTGPCHRVLVLAAPV